MAKTVLWAGPQDGLEVDVPSGSLSYYTPVITPTKFGVPPMRGLYMWNSECKRMEWKGYVK